MKNLKTTLTLLIITISINTSIAQTQNEFIEHISNVQNIHNEFMSNYLNFYTSLKNTSNSKKLSLYFGIINENKRTVKELENIQKVDWDKGLQSSLILSHKIMGENLDHSKKEYEDLLMTNEISNEQILKELLITDELNKFLFKLNKKTERDLIELCNKHNITLNDHPLNKKIELLNERINYTNEISKIYLPVLIQLEKVLESYNRNDGKSIKLICKESEQIIDVALGEIEELPKDKNTSLLYKNVNTYLNNSKYFLDKRVQYWIDFTLLEEPKTQEEVDNYNSIVKKANENVKIYNKNVENINLINNEILEYTNI